MKVIYSRQAKGAQAMWYSVNDSSLNNAYGNGLNIRNREWSRQVKNQSFRNRQPFVLPILMEFVYGAS